ncbi:hypothetical protein LPJ57_006945, partial [Coemansia sp. RSA 486]
MDSINTRIEELGSSPEKTVAVIPATTVPANANTPLQLLPPPPLPPLPPLQSAPIADQSVLQPVSISDSEFAGTLCIMVWGCVREQRTSCGSAFAIAETMRKVDSQWPFALVDGWPTAIEASSSRSLQLRHAIKRSNIMTGAMRYSSSSSEGKPPGQPFKNAPGPLPLGDAKEQRRIAELIDKVNKENTPPAGLSPEELEKFYEPVKNGDDPLKPFPNNTNPATGE